MLRRISYEGKRKMCGQFYVQDLFIHHLNNTSFDFSYKQYIVCASIAFNTRPRPEVEEVTMQAFEREQRDYHYIKLPSSFK